jgi:TetR/AcrR family transcriptional regulator, regulator of autoinduction and epiphytic fitness
MLLSRSSQVTKDTAAAADDIRRRRLLDAALATFMRFGFRKTSMEEVARAAHLSRQGLYLHFSTKEELFRATVRYALETAFQAASERLEDGEASLEQKLSGAFEQWIGRYVGMIGADVADLQEASDLLLGPVMAEHETLFLEAVTRAIRTSRLPAAYKPAGITARQLAEILAAAARGLKHTCTSPPNFADHFATTVRALCLPLHL